MSMKRIIILSTLFFLFAIVQGKNYPFDIRRSYSVEVVRVAPQGTKFYKVWGEANSVDKAIDQALQDAVAATLFTGVSGNESAGSVPAICGSKEAYDKHRDYFDHFFKKGEFLQYVRNVNSQYPSGENNVRTNKGHRVALYVEIKYDALREKLEQDGIINSLNDYF